MASKALEMWYWKNMQEIGWAEKISNEDVLKTVEEH